MKSNLGYSAKVVLTLLAGGLELAVSHVGPGELVIRDHCSPIPVGNAKLIIQVDDTREEVNVFLPFGVPSDKRRIRYSPA